MQEGATTLLSESPSRGPLPLVADCCLTARFVIPAAAPAKFEPSAIIKRSYPSGCHKRKQKREEEEKKKQDSDKRSFTLDTLGLCVLFKWCNLAAGALLKFLSPLLWDASTDEAAPSTSSPIHEEEEDMGETTSSGTMASTSTQIESAPLPST
ncbi:Hypothetical predicted protein [Scomber scombrus]|uniref:Uncharacterized protein n=1 Tax=Scomber scombrus TaxID=13677 RepID=A0AAV1N5X9_SCOSC